MNVYVEITSYAPAFAWLPTKMECGKWVWLRVYQSINGGKRKRLYEEVRWQTVASSPPRPASKR